MKILSKSNSLAEKFAKLLKLWIASKQTQSPGSEIPNLLKDGIFTLDFSSSRSNNPGEQICSLIG